ncbi:hypothetical protein KC874_04275, partial [Candidatus Saccharibacteria bacterium]|nr:hypothetical protein [Candidatus Saccharibacteria bacterium]
MIIEKKYIRFWFLVGILFALFIIGSSTMHASAAKWPGNNFADNSELMLTLSVNENHPDPSGSSVVFALYSTSSGPKTITINGYRNGNPTCGEKGYARVYSADYSFKEFKKGNCSSKDLVVTQTGTKVFQKWDDPDQSYTYYEYRIYASLYGWKDNDTQANDARFAFTVDSNDGVFYQKQGTLGTSSLPLSSNRGDVYLNNIKIPVGSCNESKLFTFITYDSDNAADYWAQTNYPDYSNFRFLKFSLEYNTGFLRANLPKVSSSGLDWKNTGTDVYYPDDRPYAPAKRPRGYISFNIPKLNNDNRSYLVLKDLGGNNFINLWVPDGADSGFGCPKKIIKPPSPGEHNWAINAQTVASSPTVLVGQPAWFNHQLRPATYGGWTSDSYTTTNVDVDVYRNGVNSDATLMDLNAFDYIDKTEKTIVDTSRPGRYCEKMVFPHGVLGTRKDVNYNNSGFTYRWAFFPGRALPNGSVLAGGYDNWWLTSTNRDQYDSTKSYNQWWSFHTHSAGESHGWENYNSLGYYQWRGKEIEASHMWEYNGFPASFPYTSNEACIEVVEPELSVTPPLDYEKGSGDKTITHTLTIPGSPNCPAIAVNWRIEGVGDTSNALDYSQNATTSFAGGTDCTKNIPITISGSQLDRLSVPFQLNYRTIVLGYPDAKGSLAIFEVPFARFYGNDIYATGTASSVGKIEF